MFSDRRNDGLNISEDLRTLEGSEGSRDFHVQLHHAQVPFGLIVGEGFFNPSFEGGLLLLLLPLNTSSPPLIWKNRHSATKFRPQQKIHAPDGKGDSHQN